MSLLHDPQALSNDDLVTATLAALPVGNGAKPKPAKSRPKKAAPAKKPRAEVAPLIEGHLDSPATAHGPGTQVIVGFPLYKTVPVKWFLNWMALDKTSLTGFVATNEVYIEAAMERLRDSAYASFPDFDWLVIMEHDVMPPAHAFTRIANYPAEYDIVSSLYFGREIPHAMAWGRAPNNGYAPFNSATIRQMADKPAAYPVEAISFGFTAIARHVFDNWDTGPMFAPKPTLVGHDFSFSERAREQGFRLWVDSGIVCGHLAERVIGLDDNQSQGPDEAEIWNRSVAGDTWQQRRLSQHVR